MRLVRAVLFLFVAAMMALAPSGAAAHLLHVCKVTGNTKTAGQAMTECCCPKVQKASMAQRASLEAATAHNADNELRINDLQIDTACCNTLSQDSTDIGSGAVPSVDAPPSAPAETGEAWPALTAVPPAATSVQRRAEYTSQGPPEPLPLFIKHCSLLN